MAAEGYPRIDVTLRNQWITNPLNPNGEIHSLLDPSKTLSYDRWSISIVYGGTSGEAYSHDEEKGICTSPCRHLSAGLNRVSSLFGHARLLLEIVTEDIGYEIIDADSFSSEIRTQNGDYIAVFRKFENSLRSINDITNSIGPLIKSRRTIESVLNFINRKDNESLRAQQRILSGRQPDNPPIFDIYNPNPAQNVFNCIIFTLEAAKAGGVDCYPLFSERIIPRSDIRPLEELAKDTIERGAPLDPEIREYMDQVETEGTISLRNLSASLNNLVVLMSEGPHVFKEYKRLLQREGLSGEHTQQRFIDESRNILSENNRRLAANEAVRALTYTPLLCVIPVAIAVESCYARSVKRKRDKEALVQFFNEE